MNTMILGGPVLALVSESMRFYTVINTEDAKQIATVVVDVENQKRKLIIHNPDSSEKNVAGVMNLLINTIDNYRHIPIVAHDSQGITFAYMLNATMDSKEPTIAKAWTKLGFELELVNDAKDVRNRVRFVGTNIQGIKQIAKASSVTLTISRK
jgi:hypothetical protein